ncbi:MAG: peptidase M6, partial [Actinomycetota bacterium]|nr:peptidase M6 [Actinomycetota bacterium]
MRRRQLAAVIALTLSMPVSIVASVGATPRTQDRTRPPIGLDDTLDVGDNYNGGRPLPFSGRARAQLRRIGADSASAARVKVGDKKTWLALDDAKRAFYLKDYKLRGIGKHIEVWVAADKDKVSRKLKFPKGDCRNGKRTKIRKAKVDYLIDEFDNNIYPKESDALSVPPKRNGTKARLDDQLDDANIPKNYWKGQGDNIVVLVDNVRDANFYDTDNKNELSYIAGFHTSFINDALDRNIMSIDAFDWKHRTGENPPNDPAPGNPCKNAPSRPFLYEGVFAHEYHHLLQSYKDPDEVNWVDEGLADWAQTLTGYVDPSRRIDDQDFDSHIQCFLGYLIVETPANPSPDPGGPENSLTLWRDQVGDHESELLCDYGAAYTMMEFLAGRYGKDFMSALHNEDAPGLEGLRAVLD